MNKISWSDDPDRPQLWARALSVPAQALIVLVLVLAIGAGIWVARSRTNAIAAAISLTQARRTPQIRANDSSA